MFAAILRKSFQSGVWMLIIGVLLFVAFLYFEKDEREYHGWSARTYLTFWSSLIIFVSFGFVRLANINGDAYLLAFAEQNKHAYQEVARLTQEMVVGNDSTKKNTSTMADGSSWEQVKVASERLKELRDEVTYYNQYLRKRRSFSSNWFLGLWYSEPPAELDYIEFTAP